MDCLGLALLIKKEMERRAELQKKEAKKEGSEEESRDD